MISNGIVIKLLTWNCLTSQFGEPYAFPMVNPSFLQWDYRSERIRKNLEKEDPDIMCLVEVDNPDYYKEKILDFKKQDELKVIYAERKDHVMGVLFAFKTEKFELLNQEIVYLPSEEFSDAENHVALHVELLEKTENKKLHIMLTHLKSKYKNANVRTKQIEKISKFIAEKGLTKENFILTGDFNLDPTSENYQQIQKIGLRSAFELFDNTNQNYIEFSTAKIRDKLYKRVIDYMLYNDNKIKKINNYLPSEKDKVDFNVALPNEAFPSDHFYLVFKFSIN